MQAAINRLVRQGRDANVGANNQRNVDSVAIVLHLDKCLQCRVDLKFRA